MRLQVGAYTRPLNEAVTSISYSPIFDQSRRMVGVNERWDTNGRVVLQSGSQANMTVALADLERAVIQSNVDLVYLEDDRNVQTAMKLRTADCANGPVLMDFGYPNQADDVYSNGMGYRVIWEGRRMTSLSNSILEFEEQIIEEPGGAEYVMVGGAVNFAERQLAWQNRPWTYIQAGRAVGMFARPSIPPPIWPFALTNAVPRITLISPRVLGTIPTEFGIQWEYRFQWHERLYGVPHHSTF